MISDKYETIFIHIPKCGGTSIEDMIWTNDEKTEENLWMGFMDKYHNKFQTGGLQHLKCTQIRQHIGRAKFESYFKFSIVRNPYSRLVSQFIYMKSRPDLRDFIGMDLNDSFLEYLTKIQRRSHVQWEQQVSFIYDFNGRCLVDLTVKLEEINSLPAQLLNKGRLPAFNAIPKKNAHDSQYDFNDFLCEESRKTIQQIYLEDFETFGYDL